MGKTNYDGTPHVIMVTWNALEYTKISLESVRKYTQIPYYLTVVDNGSSDSTLEYLERFQPGAYCKEYKIIANKENLGYGGAIDKGYKSKKCKYVCILNNDIKCSNNWLSLLVKNISRDEKLGILGPLRPVPWCIHPYSSNNTDVVLENIDQTLSPSKELKAYCKERSYDQFVKDVLKVNKFDIKYLTGPPIHIVTCCAILRSSIIDKVGGIADLDYKIFGAEDTDLSWRISTKGYNIAVTSNVYVHHFKHKSTDANKLDKKKFLKENNLIFYKKWKNDIDKFLNNEIKKGVDVNKFLSNEENYEYWLLRRLGENIGYDQLLKDVKINK